MGNTGGNRVRVVGLVLLLANIAEAHENTLVYGQAQFAQANASLRSGPGLPLSDRDACTLSLQLRDSVSGEALPGLIRITPQEGECPLQLEGLIERSAGWFSMPPEAEVKVPRGVLRIEAVHGIETGIASQLVDFSTRSKQNLTLTLPRIYDPGIGQLRSGNTHLHLRLNAPESMGVLLRDRLDADDYLQTVGGSDGLDLVYVSYLTRPGATDVFISNKYTDADLAELSQESTLFTNGVEHRHSGLKIDVRRYQEGSARLEDAPVMSYGHVMLLDLQKRSMEASIGPGLSDDPLASDGTPLRDGIVAARNQGSGVIWCHGSKGIEDIPSWVAGLIHAQNIYDGGNHGTFDTVFYPYLNSGFNVPFSTGTDWGVFDFSRVYIPSPSPFTSKVFLEQLAAGRSFITNEPFLEFSVNESVPGDRITLAHPDVLHVRGRAIGRSDFVRLQLVYNGRIVHETASREVDGHFESDLDHVLRVDESGWLALRIQPDREYQVRAQESGPGVNILGKVIFAHTSPVYITVADQPVFNPGSLEHLLAQVRMAKEAVAHLGSFNSAEESARIAQIYQEAETSLQTTLNNEGRR
jgi:hypothetical protein